MLGMVRMLGCTLGLKMYQGVWATLVQGIEHSSSMLAAPATASI
jgi:hypothetical protein